MNRNTTAILLFTRTASEEQSAKTFSHRVGASGNEKIANCLIQNSLATARKTQIPVFTSFSIDQEGNSFGQRIANAIESIFAKGFANVITIGNDCPNLTVNLLKKAQEKLNHQDLILGPTKNGGLYLIGINKKAFHRESFINLSWETADLQKSIKQYASINLNSQIWLEFLSDVNCPKGFKKIIQYVSYFSFFIEKIKLLLASKVNETPVHQKWISPKSITLFFSLRGPPTTTF